MDHFDAARLKIYRADKHISDLEAIIGSLPDRYVSSIEIDPHGRGHSIKYELPQFAEIDSEMALILGDAIHNIKSALDYCWMGATNGTTKYSKFPVRKDATELESALKGAHIDRTHPKLFKWIVGTIKPYRTGGFFIWALHELDIADKHRLLLPVIRSGNIAGIDVEDQHGRVQADTWLIQGMNVFHIDFTRDVKIHSKGKPTVEVLIDEGSDIEGLQILEALSIFRKLAASIIEEIQKFT